MKTAKFLLFTILLIIGFSPYSFGQKQNLPEQDTIIINFGKRGKMVIYVDNKEDFNVLKAYDMNALLSKIDLYLDSTYQEDYMNDTAFTFHTPVKINGDTSKREVTIRVESLEDKIDEIERNIEEAAENIEEASEDIDKVSMRLGSLHIDVNPNENDEDKVKVYRKYEETKKVRYYFTLHLGLNNYYEKDHVPFLESSPYTLDTWRSRYVAIDFLQKVKVSGPLYFTSGIELAFNNYMFRDDVTVAKLNGQVVFPQLERDTRKSKLATTYLNIPVMPMLDFKGNFKIGIGGYLGYRLASHTKIKYTNGEDRKDKDRGNFYLNDWRYGIRGMIGIKRVKFFGNYDLNTLYRGSRTPKLNAFSFGIII